MTEKTDTPISQAITRLDREKIIAIAVRSHTGGAYWDSLSAALHPDKFGIDYDGARRLAEDHEDSLPEDTDFEDDEALVRMPEFRAVVERWAQARFEYVVERLVETFGDRNEMEIMRTMHVAYVWKDRFDGREGQMFPVSELGYFWSAEDGASHAYCANPETGPEAVISAVIALEDIDLEMTVLSRMDYMNGDEEGEIRPKMDASVRLQGIEMDLEAALTP